MSTALIDTSKTMRPPPGIILHIDLWQSGQSGNFCERMFQLCKQSDHWKTSAAWVLVDHVIPEPKEGLGIMKLYFHGYTRQQSVTVTCRYGQSQSASWSHHQVRAPRGGDSGPQQKPVENLSSRKQRCKALNMESQHELRKSQYSNPPPVCICVLHFPVSVCLSLTLTPVSTYSRNKGRRIFLLKKVSCLFIMAICA